LGDIDDPTDEGSRGANGVRTVTRVELRRAIYDACVGLSRSDAERILEAFVEELGAAFERSETVTLRSFGSFKVRHKRARVGRNPKTKIEAPINARRVLTFKPSAALTARVNGETVDDDQD
jgi:integration host factor subunit alpha